MSSPTLIDDSNPAVQYSHNWTWVPNLVPEVDHTRHGVSEAGQTASLAFTGTGIQVFGTLEPSDAVGQPTTQYAIDGTVVANYTAPFTASGASVLNVTFFSKLDLSANGDHELVITNVNGTSPNMFWLDFFLVYTSTSQNPTGTGSTLGVPAVTATTATPSNAPQSKSKTISVKTAGGIIGGIAGVLVLVILLLVAYIVRLKRRHKRAARLVQPYTPPSSDGTAVAVSPRRKGGSPPILASPTVSGSAGPSSAAMSTIGPVVPISASRVNVASSTGALSEDGASAYAGAGDNASATDSGGGLLVRPPHRERPGPTRSPEEVLSLAQSLLHAVAQGQGPRRQDEVRREGSPPPAVAMDSGLRLYNEGMLPPSYSSS